MKPKLIVLLLIVIASHSSRAQGLPVYDNTSFIALAKSLVEGAKQTSEMLKTVNFLREQKQRVEQVSSAIEELQAVREIAENNQRLYDMVQRDLREVLSSPYIKPQEIDRVSESFNSIIEGSLEDLNFMQTLLTSNYLSMADAERLEILEAQRERSREMLSEIGLKKRRYTSIISFREAQDKLNNRMATH